jgi:hypothetical protein
MVINAEQDKTSKSKKTATGNNVEYNKIINAEWDIMLNGKNVDWIHQQNVDVKAPTVKNVARQTIE